MNDGPLNLNFSGVAWQKPVTGQPSLAQTRCGPRPVASDGILRCQSTSSLDSLPFPTISHITIRLL